MSAIRSCRLGVYLPTLLLSAIATAAVAQSSNLVKLEAPDQSLTLSGELIEAADGVYRLSTIAGVLEIDINSVRCIGEACPPIAPVFETGAEIRLTTADGTINIVGSIAGISAGQYVVDSDVLGRLRIGTDMVDCSGPGCPTGLQFSTGAANQSVPSQKPETPTAPKSNSEEIDPANARVSFAGSDTVGLGLLPYLLDDYADYLNATAETTSLSETETYVSYIGADQTEINSLYVNSTGSGDATDGLESKSAVLGMTSRQISGDEASRLIAAGVGDLRNTDYETVIAVDSLAVITHPSNPVTEISLTDLGNIYLGRIDNWSQLGGPDAPITVLSREDGSSTRGVFENAIFDGQEPTLADRVTYPGGDNPEMAEAVKNDPLAIGYVGFAYSEGLNRVNLASECGIVSSATSFSVKTEEYPLGRRLYLYNRPDNTPEEAENFLQYVLSPDADDAIAKSNFINFAVERTPQSASRSARLYDGLSLQSSVALANKMNSELSQWDRLSTTIRFRTGSHRLGNKELNDIERLISTLSDMPEGTRIAAVGFTDDVGPFNKNLGLSSRRAQSVADTIRTVAAERDLNIQIDTLSYSELAPSVCNTSNSGRATNRRVEIWIRN